MRKEWELLKDLIEGKIGEIEENTEVVGLISSELQLKFKKLEKEKDRFKDDVQLRRRQLELEVERKMREEFDDTKDELQVKHEALWEEVYQQCFLNPNKRYFQNKDKIFQIVQD